MKWDKNVENIQKKNPKHERKRDKEIEREREREKTCGNVFNRNKCCASFYEFIITCSILCGVKLMGKQTAQHKTGN